MAARLVLMKGICQIVSKRTNKVMYSVLHNGFRLDRIRKGTDG